MQQSSRQWASIISKCFLFIIAISFILISCKQKGTVEIPVPEDTSALSKINHFIPLDQIKAYQQAFSIQRDTLLKLQPALSLPLSEAFNKQAIIEILKDPACVGLRVSYGVKQAGTSNEFRLILTGVDVQGRDLYITGEPSPDTTNRAAKSTQSATTTTSTKGGVEQGQCNPPCN
jgi:hypothetical protein